MNQLNALGESVDNIKKIKVQKVPKKTGDMSKIKFSTKRNKGTKAGFEQSVAHTSGQRYNLPPPDRVREEARVQAEVQNRLRQLVENSKPGTEKIKSQRGGSVEVFVNNIVKWPP